MVENNQCLILLRILWLIIVVDCEWGEWKDDGKCNTDCGKGKKWQARTKIREEDLGGECKGENRQHIDCNSSEKCPSKNMKKKMCCITI